MGGGLADRPEEDSNIDNSSNNNSSNIPSFSEGNDSVLPIEKQFTQMMFCQQIQNIDLDTAKQLLTDLHRLYLGQQVFLVKWAKQDFLDTIK